MAAAEPETVAVQNGVGGGLDGNPVTCFSLHLLCRVVCLAVVPHAQMGSVATCVSIGLVCQYSIALRRKAGVGLTTAGPHMYCHRDERRHQNRQQQHQHCHTIAPFLQILSFRRVFSSRLGTMFLIIQPFSSLSILFYQKNYLNLKISLNYFYFRDNVI